MSNSLSGKVYTNFTSIWLSYTGTMSITVSSFLYSIDFVRFIPMNTLISLPRISSKKKSSKGHYQVVIKSEDQWDN